MLKGEEFCDYYDNFAIKYLLTLNFVSNGEFVLLTLTHEPSFPIFVCKNGDNALQACL